MDSNLFQNNKAFQNLTPEKLQFLLNFANMKKPTKTQEMLPFLLASMNQAKKENIQFSQPETDLLIEVLKQNLSKEECEKIDKIMNIMKNMPNKAK